MRKVVLATLFTFGWVFVASVPAVAGGNSSTPCFPGPQASTCTYTQNDHGLTQTFPSTVPCIDAPAPPGPFTGLLTLTYNDVFHITVNKAGDVWLTGTTAGTFSFTPFDLSRPSYTGHFASWFGASLNKNNYVFHDTFNVHGTGSDGSTLSFHMIDHMSVSASGVTLTFDKIAC